MMPNPVKRKSIFNYVLVVDDNRDAREILRRMLERIGIPAKVATNGMEALDVIKDEKPALIFLDLMMPMMDGFQVLSRLIADPATRRIPVIVVTGYSEGPELTNVLHLPGVIRVLRKGGYSMLELQKLVSDTLALDADWM